MRTLALDIGGTGVKALVLDAQASPCGDPSYARTPDPATPKAITGLVQELRSDLPSFERASVGFPGIVRNGVAYNAPNLGDELWAGVDVASLIGDALGVPARAINDADMQGLGVIEGEGVELVLTLGTGLGAALFTHGHLVPNLELGHHPFRRDLTYEDYVADAELKRVGAAVWSARMHEVLAQLAAFFNYDALYLGGGNLRHLDKPLRSGTRTFALEEALRGAVRVWEHSLAVNRTETD